MLKIGLAMQGLTPDEARARFWILDAGGLMTKRRDSLSHTQECFARSTTDPADQEGESLINVVRRVSFPGNYPSLASMSLKLQVMWDRD